MATRAPDAYSAPLGHPVRLGVVRLLAISGESSPRDMAEDMGGVPLGTVAYHVRALLQQGLIYETRTTPVRGAVQHFYALRLPEALEQLVAYSQDVNRALVAVRRAQSSG